MAKRAFCVGINDYPIADSDLNGCVNDAHTWASLLIDHYNFTSTDVKLITDSKATKKAMVQGIKDLLVGAQAGDVLVFTNSSHGTYVADTNGDEDTYDEAICPYDLQDNLLVDDELREIFTGIPKGVHLTVVSDSCFSGTVTRVALADNIPGLRLPDDRRIRFLNPSLLGRPVLNDPFKARPKRFNKYPESKMNELLLSGASDKEYSYDAFIDGSYRGAMTYYASQAIIAVNYKLTYAQLHSRLRFLIEDGGYPQHPQLEGKAQNKKWTLFA